MSLRGPKKPKPRVVVTETMTFRCPIDIKDHLEATSKAEDRTQTELIISGVTLERDLTRMLGPHLPKIEHYAAAAGLDMDNDLPRILSMIILEGLTALDAQSAEGRKTKR